MIASTVPFLIFNITVGWIFGFKGASTSQVIGARNEMMMDDYDGQMIFGDLRGLKLHDIRLTGKGKPRKKPHPGNLSRPGIEPGPAARQARMLPLVPQRWTTLLFIIVSPFQGFLIIQSVPALICTK